MLGGIVGGPYFLASVVLFFVLCVAYVVVSIWRRPGLQVDAIGISSVIGVAFGVPPALRVLHAALWAENLGVLSGLGSRIYLIIGATLALLAAILALGHVFRAAWRGGPDEETKE